MKKLFFFGALLAQAAMAEAEVSSKFFIELDGGSSAAYVGQAKGTTQNVNITDPVGGAKDVFNNYFNQVNSTWGGPGVTALLNFGYDCKLQNSNVVLGAFLGGGVSKMSARLPYPGILSNTVNSLSYRSPAVYWSTRGRLQAGMRLGFVALRSILPVFTLGWSTFSTKTKLDTWVTGATTGATRAYASVGKWVNCLMVGFGLEFNLSHHLVLGVTTNAHIGGKTKYSFAKYNKFLKDDGNPDIITYSFAPVFTEMLVTLKYAMPTCGAK